MNHQQGPPHAALDTLQQEKMQQDKQAHKDPAPLAIRQIGKTGQGIHDGNI
jgi:hypothetical protein